MKQSKSFLLGTAVALAMLPLSLSAVNPDDLVETIRTARACHAPIIIEQEAPAAQGWFSSFRKAAGNSLRTIGDSLRTEGNKSAVGQVKEFAKEGFFAVASAKIGFSLNSAKDSICNAFGNGLRTVGQWIKGGEATPTPIRVFVDNADLTKGGASDLKMKTILKAAEAQNLDIEAVADKIADRGYASRAQMKAIDLNAIRVEVLAEEELRANNALTCSVFQAVILKGFDALQGINSVKEASSVGAKIQVRDQYLKDMYNNIKVKQDFDNMRNAVLVAPAA